LSSENAPTALDTRGRGVDKPRFPPAIESQPRMSVVNLIEHMLRFDKGVGEGRAHADLLAALARKKRDDAHARLALNCWRKAGLVDAASAGVKRGRRVFARPRRREPYFAALP